MINCLSRRYAVADTPEERVRQQFIAYMTNLGYPLSLIACEVPVTLNGRHLRADIVVYSRDLRPLLLVECKAPDVTLTEKTMTQACRYLAVLRTNYVVLTNGKNTYIVQINADGTKEYCREMPKLFANN